MDFIDPIIVIPLLDKRVILFKDRFYPKEFYPTRLAQALLCSWANLAIAPGKDS